MIDINRKYWFYIFPYIHVSQTKNGQMLLYDTTNASYIETESNMCTHLIDEIYKPANLGVVELESKYVQNPVCLQFISEIVKKCMGKAIEITPANTKPINLLPILNLQKDADKTTEQDKTLIIDGSIRYLSELNIYINDSCNCSCKYCNTYYQQSRYCHTENTKNTLLPEFINSILSQAIHSSTKRVNILGGNILLYPYWEELLKKLKHTNYEFHYWINYQNLYNPKNVFDFNKLPIKDILINFPTEENAIQHCLSTLSKHPSIKFHFVVENEKQASMADNLISSFNPANYTIIPVYTVKNKKFFAENIYIDKKDILSTVTPLQTIFCNQKLNSNDFGKLTILPDGRIKANLTTDAVGNIYSNTLLEAIHKELTSNTAWRVTRSSAPCNDCLYQYLCPPPINYEKFIGKANLCKVLP